MLSRLNRLQKTKDFDRIFKKGKRFKEGFLEVWVVKNNLKNSRFGFVVGKSISKKANIRNTTKRTLRELVRAKISKTKNGLDGIVMARPGIETKDHWEIEGAINKIFNRANILK